MSHGFVAVGWNRQKRNYDLVLLAGVVLYLALFSAVSLRVSPEATFETVALRGLGSLGLLLLHLILCIGPLARLDRRFLPLLYNRRHLGVTTCLLGLCHAALATFQFHALGDRGPVRSLLTSNPRLGSLAQFPFELLGLGALLILFAMAATSHDFWLKQLGPARWKSLHMLVYPAWVLLVGHVALGALQTPGHRWLALPLGVGLCAVLGLHLALGLRERAVDRQQRAAAQGGFIELCALEEIGEGRARVFSVEGERVALFRRGDQAFALSNVCRHQQGPLGEGRIVDGCATCPWHGWQYQVETGLSPPPFTERVETFAVRLVGGRVFIHPRPLLHPRRTDP